MGARIFMAPYAAAVRQATGLPVYSMYSFIQWFQAGLLPRQFDRQVMDPGIFPLAG